jgi:hypothetical protein
MPKSFMPGDSVKILSLGDEVPTATVLEMELNGIVKVRLADGEEIEVSAGDLRRLNQ